MPLRMILVAMLFISGCKSLVPWSKSVPDKVTIAVTADGNLLRSTERIGGRPARLIFGSAHPHTLTARPYPPKTQLELGGRRSVPINPIQHDLAGLADAIVGMDAWRRSAVTFDYTRSIIVVGNSSSTPTDMYVERFAHVPTVTLLVDGRSYSAIVDVASPDSLQIPSSATRRSSARVEVAGSTFETDVLFTDVSHARVGARLLANFLVTIDYPRKEVQLWRRTR